MIRIRQIEIQSGHNGDIVLLDKAGLHYQSFCDRSLSANTVLDEHQSNRRQSSRNQAFKIRNQAFKIRIQAFINQHFLINYGHI